MKMGSHELGIYMYGDIDIASVTDLGECKI